MATRNNLKNRVRQHGTNLRSTLERHASSMATAHTRCLFESLGRLQRRWLASLLTILVIGIALTLPTGLYILVKNLDTLSSSWHQSVRISLYLKKEVDSRDGQALADKLARNDKIDQTHFISAEEGLRQFKKESNFGAALDALGENPLPGVISVTPDPDLSPGPIGDLVDALDGHEQVDHAALDQEWLRRLTAILNLISRSSWVIGILLSAAVVFIVGNTIRLDIENRRHEIEVMKLLGASDAFIRRPFLYSGVWYGLLGAVTSLITLGLCYLALRGPLSTLVSSYDGRLAIQGLSFRDALLLLASGIALGWLGCAITVNRRLTTIEPG